MTTLASQAPLSSYFLCVSKDAVQFQDLPVLLLHTGLTWKLAGTETENALGEQQIIAKCWSMQGAHWLPASHLVGPWTLHCVYLTPSLTTRNTQRPFLSGHFCGKLDLPEVFISIFLLSFGTKRPSTAFLGSVLYKYVWLPRNYALTELYQCFPAREKPPRGFITSSQWLLNLVALWGNLLIIGDSIKIFYFKSNNMID